MKMKYDFLFVAMCAFGGLTSYLVVGQMMAEESCRLDLEHERALRDQSERITHDLIYEMADEWCEDSLIEAWNAVRLCEEEGVDRFPNTCSECWEAWEMDMEGSCRDIMMYDFQVKAEDTITLRSVQALWQDYTNARLRDCESRNLNTKAERQSCLGPAAQFDEIQHALEAMFIHQQSKSF